MIAIWVQDYNLRLLAYNALTELLTNKTQLYLSSANFEFRINAVEFSDLPEIVTQLIEIAPKREFMRVLNIADTLSKISSTICMFTTRRFVVTRDHKHSSILLYLFVICPIRTFCGCYCCKFMLK